jgi:hypothetical protein
MKNYTFQMFSTGEARRAELYNRHFSAISEKDNRPFLPHWKTVIALFSSLP